MPADCSRAFTIIASDSCSVSNTRTNSLFGLGRSSFGSSETGSAFGSGIRSSWMVTLLRCEILLRDFTPHGYVSGNYWSRSAIGVGGGWTCANGVVTQITSLGRENHLQFFD